MNRLFRTIDFMAYGTFRATLSILVMVGRFLRYN